MRKVLSIGLFLCAAVVVALDPQATSMLAGQIVAGVAARPPVELARDYGVMLLVLAMPTAVLAWGVWRQARARARTEV